MFRNDGIITPDFEGKNFLIVQGEYLILNFLQVFHINTLSSFNSRPPKRNDLQVISDRNVL